MERRTLGRTGLEVPVVGMGTWQTFDVRGDLEIAERGRIVATALRSGTSLFDTSPMYGESERVLGQALDGRRHDAIIADKIWTSSPQEGRAQAWHALAWYGGCVDIYQVHNLVAWREHLPMLGELRDAGKVRVIGATHYQHAAFPELLKLMHGGRIAMVQVPYNAADRVVEREVLPLAEELGTGVLVMQPLGTGSLVRQAPHSRELGFLERYGIRTWAQALLKWILSDGRVHAVLPATSHAERARENAAAGERPWFDEETRERVAGLVARG